MMQGGGVNKLDGKFKTAIAAPIINESTNGLSHLTGTIAMARTSDPNSATSQFFINFVDNKFLDYTSATSPGYAVFGKVATTRSMNVVKKVASLPNFSDVAFTNTSSLVTIDAVYSSDILDATQSITRISLSGLGNVVSTPVGIDCGIASACTLSQATGSAMSLKATAAAGYYFSGWRGDCSGFRRSINLDTTLGNHNCTAVFSRLGAITQ
jgi:cyclophilin family peptidyl-prolyl cis-trans isomerase